MVECVARKFSWVVWAAIAVFCWDLHPVATFGFPQQHCRGGITKGWSYATVPLPSALGTSARNHATKVGLPSFVLHTKEISDEDKDEQAATKSRIQTALLNGCIGALCIVGGIIDIVVTRRILPGGINIVFGGLLERAALWIFRDDKTSKSALKGYQQATILSGILSVVMVRRYFQTRIYVPTGVVATLAIIAWFYNGVDVLVAKAEEKKEDP